jgi:hypothetical protein
MKKILSIAIITGIAMIGSTFANNDCNIVVGSGIESTVNAYGTTYIHVLSGDAFRQALSNLKAHCCLKNIITCTSEEKKNLPNQNFPESEFLFDHLFDVAMRRLDGITWLAYNLSPDPTGIERRAKLTEIANDATGAQAITIEKMYKDYWTIHNYIRSGTCVQWTDLNIIITNYNKDIATVSLGDKYNTLCELMKNIYNKTRNSNKTRISDFLFNRCKSIVQERIKRETGYTKIIMIQKSNQLLDETTKAYTKKHFVEEKLMALWNLITKVKDAFQTMVQQAPASKTCSI